MSIYQTILKTVINPMQNKLKTNQYYFSVEGETEMWYLEWLMKSINMHKDITSRVSFIVKKKNPLSYAKNVSSVVPVDIIHICDRESTNKEHTDKFRSIINEMDDVIKTMSNRVNHYDLGYSNFTFELWLILHKGSCNTHLNSRTDYRKIINKVFQKRFSSLDDFKTEKNFKNILSVLSIEDVKGAIKKAAFIEKENRKNYQYINYKNYHYYDQNPSLQVFAPIKKILIECGLLQQTDTIKNADSN